MPAPKKATPSCHLAKEQSVRHLELRAKWQDSFAHSMDTSWGRCSFLKNCVRRWTKAAVAWKYLSAPFLQGKAALEWLPYEHGGQMP